MENEMYVEAHIVFEKMRQEIHDLNVAHGWRDGRVSFGDYIALLHSEVSEMLEEYRNHNDEEMKLEYADVLIRLIDMADVFGVNIIDQYEKKMAINLNRPIRHGGKRL